MLILGHFFFKLDIFDNIFSVKSRTSKTFGRSIGKAWIRN